MPRCSAPIPRSGFTSALIVTQRWRGSRCQALHACVRVRRNTSCQHLHLDADTTRRRGSSHHDAFVVVEARAHFLSPCLISPMPNCAHMLRPCTWLRPAIIWPAVATTLLARTRSYMLHLRCAGVCPRLCGVRVVPPTWLRARQLDCGGGELGGRHGLAARGRMQSPPPPVRAAARTAPCIAASDGAHSPQSAARACAWRSHCPSFACSGTHVWGEVGRCWPVQLILQACGLRLHAHRRSSSASRRHLYLSRMEDSRRGCDSGVQLSMLGTWLGIARLSTAHMHAPGEQYCAAVPVRAGCKQSRPGLREVRTPVSVVRCACRGVVSDTHSDSCATWLAAWAFVRV